MRYTEKDIDFALNISTQRDKESQEEIRQWMEDPGHIELLKELAAIRENGLTTNTDELLEQELRRIQRRTYRKKWLQISGLVAASIMLLVASFITWNSYQNPNHSTLSPTRISANSPKGAVAELILPEGNVISLNSSAPKVDALSLSGIENDSIGGLNYSNIILPGNMGEEIYHTLRVPIGGFYQLVLSDGTKIWLNSESELRYAVKYTGDKRIVDLKGEAYFEVTPDESRPFEVRLGEEAHIIVLGTAFNINAYGDEGDIYTTLARGAVRFYSTKSQQSIVLKPGMQGVMNLQTGEFQLRKVEVDSFIAWKEGRFVFESLTLEAIIHQLQRWYDFKVYYQSEELKEYEFKGVIYKDMELKSVLDIIAEATTIDFTINEDMVTIKKR